MSQTIRTDPKLWEKTKKQVLRSPKGGMKDKWSARKAQLAVAIYKKKGGKYKGKKSRSNSLVKWSNEDWDYITKGKKSGRYLPKKVRDTLTPREKRLENKIKGTKKGEWVPYSDTVRKKVSRLISRRRIQ